MIYWISAFILKIIAKLYHRAEIYGKENFPEKGPFIGVVNHNSNIDIIAMAGAVRHKVHTMAKDSLFRVPVLKWWLRAVGMFPVIRNSSDQKAFNYAVNILKQGKVLFIAPEGTRRKNKDQQMRIRTGFVRLAQMVSCPVIPVAISGTNKALPPGALFLRPVKIKVKIGKPFQLEKISKEKNNKEIYQLQADNTMKIIYDMLAELEKW
ncbi:1-acyl-sn-glycerol-3-phosphate acyltransferase [candidate division KSB1 bacterium]|nr:1-acyl-sn-glycerol-3-phosphate acyltransferase [candidate division KSB1 bacterium]MBL7094498.1 1-acyl-sn-glycerol-3-phosphate acyltransferase [candidate division KSB1 bacterium]